MHKKPDIQPLSNVGSETPTGPKGDKPVDAEVCHVIVSASVHGNFVGDGVV